MTEEVKPKISRQEVVKGLENTLESLQPELLKRVDDMSTKQLRRLLKAVVNFICTAQDDTDTGALGQLEQKTMGAMILAIETSRQYYLHILKELQEEQENAKKETEDGEKE